MMLTGAFISAARAATRIKCFFMSFLPSMILEVVYVDPMEGEVTTQYNAMSNYFNWSNNAANYMMVNDGYYALTVWNSNIQMKESYFLSAPNLCRAFHLKSLYSFWAYTQAGVVEILSNYLEGNRGDSGSLFAILTETSDLSADPRFRPFMKTLALCNNATPRAILLFYNWLREDYTPTHKFIVYDHDLDERELELDDYLFTRET